MPLLEWNPSLVLGVPSMDAEHEELVAAMQRIHQLASRSADKATVGSAIDHLVRLTRRHFADEERHMEAIDFPDRKRHARIHADLLRRVAEHQQEFAKGDGKLAPAFFDFLSFWLSAHIKGIDRRYAEHQSPVKR